VAERTGEFLLELGFEEMPAPWLPGLAEQLKARFTEAGEREFLKPASVEVYWTPRRLVLRADVLLAQADREEAVWGPALKAAKDAAGAWTGAALGFAKKAGVAVDELKDGVKEGAKAGERNLVFMKKTAGRPAGEVVSSLLPGVLRALAFPKRMNWDAWLEDGKGGFPFGRPLRWVLALLDGTVVPFVIYEMVAGAKGRALVASGPATFGHRFLPKGRTGKPITGIRSFAGLESALAEAGVLVDPADRLARIAQGLAAANGGKAPARDHGLPDEWRDLVEYPTVLAGEIPAEFRSLPDAVLETVLVHHQKYVPLAGGDGRPARFAAVVNGDGASGAEIVRGMQRVVVARFRDAAFFWSEDRRRPLADRVEDLSRVTFHKGLGTYRDKADRMAGLVQAMHGQNLLSDAQRDAAIEAARLAKADLTTAMVREFPELQGVMGALYLEAAGGARPDVVDAVRWHYHPVSIEKGSEPSAAFAGRDARVFAAVALADKLDSLVGYFHIGEQPTGSRDPFGLRRAAQGIVRILVEFWGAKGSEPSPKLGPLLDAAQKQHAAPKGDGAAVRKSIEAFLQERLEHYLEALGFPAAEVAAAVHPGEPGAWEDVRDCQDRLQSLHSVRQQAGDDFTHLATAFKRAKNILGQGQPAASVDPSLFESEAEKGLYDAVAGLQAGNGDYDTRLRSLARLRAPVDRFFDDVMVMAEDPKVRGNRLSLLRQTLTLFYRIADISRLGGQS
jgi:glycyl-tRNA synthetase beta chain